MAGRAHGNAISMETADSSMAVTTLLNSADWAKTRQTISVVRGFEKEFLTMIKSELARKA